jgi:FKBP-type peptidyl-prolyl cis-trans isomerase (trigger factor)
MEQFRPVAASQVKGALLLHELAEKVGLTVSDSDVEARLRKISAESGQEYDRISKYYLQNADAKQGLEEQIREEKVLDLIAAKAVVVEKKKSEILESSTVV